ncbi:zinc finger protein ZAT2 [Raphanus sativus]|uniref:Zinc finger protein ZAT2 n=1 Tax=Raphanus sativus TaxID=3726 RepID=A0A6J0JR38_RAPSA|nr:zinc finger protein ZAT2 [Raphanus sativus]
MNNNIELNLTLNPSSAPPNETPPSHNQTPRRKRTRRTSNNETGSSSSPRPKPDPDAPLITEPCKVCGRKFWSSKALHGHMRSHPERQWRGINPPPNHQPTVTAAPPVSVTAEGGQVLAIASTTGSSAVGVECEGCKKMFESRQALDGHICSAILNLNEEPPPSPPPPPPPQEVVDESRSVMLASRMNHRCDICSKVFYSGQALGGHMRCHWVKDKEKKQASTGIDLNVPASSTNLQPGSSSDAVPESSLDLKLRL